MHTTVEREALPGRFPKAGTGQKKCKNLVALQGPLRRCSASTGHLEMRLCWNGARQYAPQLDHSQMSIDVFRIYGRIRPSKTLACILPHLGVTDLHPE
jgi:hypothetical protein